MTTEDRLVITPGLVLTCGRRPVVRYVKLEAVQADRREEVASLAIRPGECPDLWAGWDELPWRL